MQKCIIRAIIMADSNQIYFSFSFPLIFIFKSQPIFNKRHFSIMIG